MTPKPRITAHQQVQMDKMEAELAEFDGPLDELLATNVRAGGHESDPHRVELDRLRTGRRTLQAQVDKFKEASQHEHWPEFEAGIRTEWRALKADVQRLVGDAI